MDLDDTTAPAASGDRTERPKMISVSNAAVGVTFDRPADWIVDEEPPPYHGPGVDVVQPLSIVDGVREGKKEKGTGNRTRTGSFPISRHYPVAALGPFGESAAERRQ